jgi:hypothetical protein
VVVLPPKPVGRPHQVGVTSTQKGVRYELREINTGEMRSSGVLGPKDKEVLINVKGPTELRATDIERLRVRIDGVPFLFPASAQGEVPVNFPDLETTPPIPDPVGTGQAPTKSKKKR